MYAVWSLAEGLNILIWVLNVKIRRLREGYVFLIGYWFYDNNVDWISNFLLLITAKSMHLFLIVIFFCYLTFVRLIIYYTLLLLQIFLCFNSFNHVYFNFFRVYSKYLIHTTISNSFSFTCFVSSFIPLGKKHIF